MSYSLRLALFLFAACSDGSKDAATSPSGDTAAGTTTNPTNPNGDGPAPVGLGSVVDLGAPAAYAIVAKTAITNVTGSAITGGNVAISPAGASFITGFSLALDPTSVFSTSVVVTAPAKVYAADYLPPTPLLLTSLVLAMEAAYDDAAGRSLPNHLNLNSGDLGGATLSPGLYTWGSTVTIPSDVTIDGGANDVWIFQVANNLDVGTDSRVVLSGGADAGNIFWQVAGEATLHANSHFEGILLSKTGVSLQTGASLHGRIFAQSLVALDDNAVTTP